jgi:DNA-binding YbaB/EbfC family protein
MDLQRLMQQANAMQKKMAKIEEELDASVYSGNNGGESGVTVKVNGKNEVVEVNIADDLLSKDSKEELQDMIMLAVNEAEDKATQDRKEKMDAVTQGIRMPGM